MGLGLKLAIFGGIAAGAVITLTRFRGEITGSVNDAAQTVGNTFGQIPAGIVQGFEAVFNPFAGNGGNDDTPSPADDSPPTSADFNEDGALAGDEELFKENKDRPILSDTETQEGTILSKNLDFSDLIEESDRGVTVSVPVRTTEGTGRIVTLPEIIRDGRLSPEPDNAEDPDKVIGLFDFPDTEFVESVPLSQNAVDFFNKIGRNPVNLLDNSDIL